MPSQSTFTLSMGFILYLPNHGSTRIPSMEAEPPTISKQLKHSLAQYHMWNTDTPLQ